MMDVVKSAIKLERMKLTFEFLGDCLEEQVIPRSFPRRLRTASHPFPEGARLALEEAKRNVSGRLDAAPPVETLDGSRRRRVDAATQRRRSQLRRKLSNLCDNSPWHDVGRCDIVTNLSGVQLSRDQVSALGLGLKFAVGKPKLDSTDLLVANHRRGMSDLDAGFLQGVVAVLDSISRKQTKPCIPRRFVRALESLGKRNDIVITHADKGGGIVVLSLGDYRGKMGDLLSDESTYREVGKGTTDREAKLFNYSARRILKRSEAGRGLLCLLEEDPRNPRMRGLPKVHKPGVPMRPITSGVGSAPHKLAKVLAKPLSRAMGSISGAHLRNSGDLKNRMAEVSLRNKKLVSFDVKSLFTKVPTQEALEAVRLVVSQGNVELPLPVEDFVKLVELCVGFNFFEFGDKEYRQVHGMAMGSPLSAVLANLFMEMLEIRRIRRLIGDHVTWLRYVDDTLVVLPRRTDVGALLASLNSVHDDIEFTVEEEVDGVIPFLDTLIHRGEASATFSVYRKPTNRDDFIHFFSGHDMRTKSGVIIGFFLRALRICDEEFLDEEIQYILGAFQRLRYPKDMLLRCLTKARLIMERPRVEKPDLVRIVVPPSTAVGAIQSYLAASVSFSTTCGRRIQDLVSSQTRASNENSVVYEVPCGGCDLSYVGETHRGLKIRLDEHRRDMRRGALSNALVLHRDSEGHLPRWEQSRVIAKCGGRAKRRLTESILICAEDRLNTRESSYRVASVLGRSLASHFLKDSRVSDSESVVP